MGDFLHWGLPACQMGPLLRMQFEAQTVSYRAQYPDSLHSIVLVGDAPAGRIMVDRAASRFLLVDISILPAFQHRGLGTALVSDVIAEAGRTGVPVQCHVAKTNQGSLRFHQRLGFEIVNQDGVYYALSTRLNSARCSTMALAIQRRHDRGTDGKGHR
jgi:ribosomal protein S18 acetylase RimI-like enzyme